MFDGTYNECLPKRTNNTTRDKEKTPTWQNFNLTAEEAADYFNIGINKLRQFANEHRDEEFLLWSGNRVLFKRRLFEEYIDKINII